jgi:hypothetical protein
MSMSSDPVLRRVHVCVEAGIPALLIGPPGGGKTKRIESYGRARGKRVVRWLLSRCEPIDLKPRMYDPTKGKVVVLDPPEYDLLTETAIQKLGAIMFFDEFNRCARDVEGSALDRIDSSPAHIAVIAAANPPSRGQAARSLESAAANRFCHLEAKPDAKAWARAQVYGWPEETADFPSVDAKTLAPLAAKYATLAGAYVEANPDKLEVEPTDPVKAGRAWPSARTHENAHKLYAVATALGYETDDKVALLCGCVGDGVGTELATFFEDADLINPEDWLAKPKGFLPERADKVLAALSAVSHAIKTNLTDKRWRAAWEIVTHLNDNNMMGGAMVGAEQILAIHRTLIKSANAADKKLGQSLSEPSQLMPPRMAHLMV